MTRILALDWGGKRIGVAFSEGFLASPHSVIYRTTKKNDYQKIADLVTSMQAQLLVIGLPKSFNPDMPLGPQAKRVLKHKQALADLLDIPIEMSDETYSTVDAEALLEVAGKRNKIPIDAAAAALILQTFLDNRLK